MDVGKTMGVETGAAVMEITRVKTVNAGKSVVTGVDTVAG